MAQPRDQLSVTVDPGDWYGTSEGEAYYSREDPEPTEPRTWTPYPKKGTPMGRTEPGYKRQRKVLKLVFEDPDMEGLVVRARSTSVRKFLDIQAMADQAEGGKGAAEQMEALFTSFADVVIDWNLQEDDGTPVPVSAVALLDEDFDFAFAMVTAWLEAVAGVTKGLGKESTPAATLPAESTLSEIPSTPLLSSSVPA